MGVMKALYPGTCKRCGGGIAEGDEIDWLGKGKGANHAVCPANPAPPPPPRKVTPGQLDYIEKLGGYLPYAQELTMDQAGTYIDDLKAQAKGQTGKKYEEVPDGHYALEFP